MRDVLANDFTAFFEQYPSIPHIYFNGRKAEQLYRKLVLPHLLEPYDLLVCECLLSTSPAHAAMHVDEKYAEWKKS